jgi:AcrR family transcriptional regulator
MTEATAEQARETKERILNVAERMFAEHGYRAVSLRSITRKAEVNNASIHYHFGSKEELLREIFAQRGADLNAERSRRLFEYKSITTGLPAVEEILDAFLRPSFFVPNGEKGARRFMRLRALVAQEDAPLAKELMRVHFDQVSRSFVEALSKALPGLPIEELHWRFHFLIGALYWTVAAPSRIRDFSRGLCDPSDTSAVLNQLITFLSAGLRAPIVSTRKESVSLP